MINITSLKVKAGRGNATAALVLTMTLVNPVQEGEQLSKFAFRLSTAVVNRGDGGYSSTTDYKCDSSVS